MRYFISARHGDYTGEDRSEDMDELTPRGIKEIKDLAQEIKKLTGLGNICLASTDAKRVVKSAEILRAELDISDYTSVYGRDENGEIARDTAFKIYSSKEGLYSAMIFVSHDMPVSTNAGYIAMKRGFKEELVSDLVWGCSLNTGNAIVLDLEQKTYNIIREVKIPVKITSAEGQEDSPF